MNSLCCAFLFNYKNYCNEAFISHDLFSARKLYCYAKIVVVWEINYQYKSGEFSLTIDKYISRLKLKLLNYGFIIDNKRHPDMQNQRVVVST